MHLNKQRRTCRNLLLMCAIAFVALYVFFFAGMFAVLIPQEQPKQEISTATSTHYFHVPEILVALNNNENQTAHLAIYMSLEVEIKHAHGMSPQRREIIFNIAREFLTTRTVADFATMKEINKVRTGLLLRINKAIQPIVVRDIVFSQMLIN